MTHDLMIEAHGLRKRFGPTVALDGIDLEVPAGAILGVQNVLTYQGRACSMKDIRC